MNTIEIKNILLEELKDDFLDHFNRHQEVTKVWRKHNNDYVIEDIYFVEQWNEKDHVEIISILRRVINNKGYVFAAYDDKKIIGFAGLGGRYLDEANRYIQLVELHVSSEYRRKGIGVSLFNHVVEQAKTFGASKLYISSHSAIETHAFYTRQGCVEAKWIWDEQVNLEPCDCQLEYKL